MKTNTTPVVVEEKSKAEKDSIARLEQQLLMRMRLRRAIVDKIRKSETLRKSLIEEQAASFFSQIFGDSNIGISQLSPVDVSEKLSFEDSYVPSYEGLSPNEAVIAYTKYIRSLKSRPWYYSSETHSRDQRSLFQYQRLHRNILIKAQQGMPSEAISRINGIIKSDAASCHIDFFAAVAETIIEGRVDIPLAKAQITLGPEREPDEPYCSFHKRLMEFMSDQYTIKKQEIVEHIESTKLTREELIISHFQSRNIVAMIYARLLLRGHLLNYGDEVNEFDRELAEVLSNNQQGPVSIARVFREMEKILGKDKYVGRQKTHSKRRGASGYNRKDLRKRPNGRQEHFSRTSKRTKQEPGSSN